MLNRRYGDKLLEDLHRAVAGLPHALVLTALVVTSVGCADILGIEDIEYVEDVVPIDPCLNPEGFEGRGCFRTDGDCKPSKEQIPNTCTDSPCIPFDNQKRLGLSLATELPKITTDMPSTFGPPGMGASPPCPTPTANNPNVVVVGSNAIYDVVRYVSAELSRSMAPVTVLYQSLSSCNGAAAALDDLKVGGDFSYWTYENNTITMNQCSLPEGFADIGVSDVFAATCGLDDNERDTLGPIQAMIFAAPRASSERAISAEAARLIYGYGGSYQEERFTSPPWTNSDFILRRNSTSGTQHLIGKVIGVPSASFKGTPKSNPDEMISALAGTLANDATPTIGILDVVNGDPQSTTIRVLAFQAEGQHCAFQPDSVEGAFDRRNVRDGHYGLWGPLHIFTRMGGATAAGDVVKFLALEKAPPLSGQTTDQSMSELIKVTTNGSLVPACAMRVKRAVDGGQLVPVIPPAPCGCLFDQLNGIASQCTTCNTSDDCDSSDTPVCRFGFCEDQ